MKLLELKDKPLVDKYLKLKTHTLSIFYFASIFVWQKLYNIYYQLINGALCIFFQDRIGIFMPLPALGGTLDAVTIDEVFTIMDGINKNRKISRIENIEEAEAEIYQSFTLDVRDGEREYLYARRPLADLSGDKFKSQRASYNYFIKHYNYQFVDFLPSMKEEGLGLYKVWMQDRMKKSNEPVYQGMLKDNLSTHKIALENYQALGFTAKAVLINGEVKAYSFGFGLNKKTFCIVAEICQPGIKGLPQFIFREFCRHLDNYAFINAMGDSGLSNLRRVKLSYKPLRQTPSCIAYKNYA